MTLFKTSMEKGMNKQRKDQCEIEQKVRDGLAVKEEKKPVGMIGRKDLEFEPVEPEKY